MKKTYIIVSIIVIAGAGLAVWLNKSNTNFQPTVCTMEAKLCPDGSTVGRTGPNCEFTACPEDVTPVPTPPLQEM